MPFKALVTGSPEADKANEINANGESLKQLNAQIRVAQQALEVLNLEDAYHLTPNDLQNVATIKTTDTLTAQQQNVKNNLARLKKNVEIATTLEDKELAKSVLKAYISTDADYLAVISLRDELLEKRDN